MTKEQYENLERLVLSMQKQDNKFTINTAISTLLPIVISSVFWIIVFSTKVKEDINNLNSKYIELKANYEEVVKKDNFNKVLKQIDHNFKTVAKPNNVEDRLSNIYDVNN